MTSTISEGPSHRLQELTEGYSGIPIEAHEIHTKPAIGTWQPNCAEASGVGGEARNQKTQDRRQSGLINQLVAIEVVNKPQKGGEGAVV